MNKMNVSSLLLFAACVLFCSSCAKDTTGPDPVNARDKFLGTWTVNETHTKLTYEVTITADESSVSEVDIYNFAAAGGNVKAKAEVSGSAIGISPANQTLSNGWIVDGSGSISGTTKINWNYTIDDGATLIYSQATYTKK